MSVSETAKLNHILTEVMLGDCAPRQLLRKIKQLSGDKVGTELLESLWLLRLPGMCKIRFLDTLATTADKIREAHTPHVVGKVSHDMSNPLAPPQQMAGQPPFLNQLVS